ncbi:MAG: phosphoglycerate kinase [Promethearchaeota archaeon]
MRQFLEKLDEAWAKGYEYIGGSPIVIKRTDINSPMSDANTILGERRIREALHTTVELRKAGAVAVSDGAHQSRPGKVDFYPLIAHARLLNRILQKEYAEEFLEWKYVFSETCWGLTQFNDLTQGKNVLSNNLRFAPWETQVPHNLFDTPPVRLIEKLRLAGQRVCYVQDAFASAHRGSTQKDASMLALPSLLKRRGIPVFPSRSFAEEMIKYAKINEQINKNKKVVVALFGAKVTDYLDVLRLYTKHENIKFITGSILSLVFLKSQNPSLNFGPTEERFFKNISSNEMKQFEKYYDPDRIYIAQDLIEQTPQKLIFHTLKPQSKIKYEVQGIGPDTVQYYADKIKGSQLLIINGCPFNINRFETLGDHFKKFMKLVRKRNGKLKIYGAGGDAITAIEFTGIKTDISSTAGKLGLLAPMVETMEDLNRYAPAVIPLIR